MAPTKKLYYDLALDDQAPLAGKFLVSIGKKGIGSLYHIASVRLVAAKKPRPYARYTLDVYPANELKPSTVYDADSSRVWVQGEEGYLIFWYPRPKAKK